MYINTQEKTIRLGNTLNLEPPFILQVGEERTEIKERGRLEFSENLTQMYDNDDPLGPPVPLASTAQEVRLWIGARLAFSGGGWGVKEFGQYFKPDSGLPEVHLDPRIVRPVT